jgi:hypothetical protein
MIVKAQLFAGNPYIQVRWSLSDVLARCVQLEITLTMEEGIDVLKRIKANHSEDEGISWALIDLFIEEVINDR